MSGEGDIANKVANFVQEVRMANTQIRSSIGNPVADNVQQRNDSSEMSNFVGMEDPIHDARDFAGCRIIEAEKFKAAITPRLKVGLIMI